MFSSYTGEESQTVVAQVRVRVLVPAAHRPYMSLKVARVAQGGRRERTHRGPQRRGLPGEERRTRGRSPAAPAARARCDGADWSVSRLPVREPRAGCTVVLRGGGACGSDGAKLARAARTCAHNGRGAARGGEGHAARFQREASALAARRREGSLAHAPVSVAMQRGLPVEACILGMGRALEG